MASGDLEFEMKPGRHDAISLMGALRQMKDSLLHSKLDYQGQINAIAKVQGVIECSLDGDVTNANEIFLNVLGLLARGCERTRTIRCSSTPRTRRATRDCGRRCSVARAGRASSASMGRDKQEVWFQGVFNPIVDATGKPFKVVAYLNDVTRSAPGSAVECGVPRRAGSPRRQRDGGGQRPEDHLREPRRRRECWRGRRNRSARICPASTPAGCWAPASMR